MNTYIFIANQCGMATHSLLAIVLHCKGYAMRLIKHFIFDEKKEVFFPADEEGYDLYVACVEDEFDWEQLDAPYHDPEIFEERKTRIQAFKQYKVLE